MKENLNDLRVNYNKYELLEENIGDNPFELFKIWFDEARNDKAILEVNAMTLATVDENLQANARIVLLKEFNSEGFIFFTNYNSRKGQELSKHNRASILFYWASQYRQVRIQGEVSKISRYDTETYFNSRPYESRIGAMASEQSSVLKSREILEARFEDLKVKYPENPPCPENWGGYILRPNYFEFWQGRTSRLHDRIIFQKDINNWNIERLNP